jgi:hypothetical protein
LSESRFRDSISAPPAELPPVIREDVRLSSLVTVFRYRAPSCRFPPGRPLGPRHFPYPEVSSLAMPSRKRERPWDCYTVQGVIPFAKRLLTHRQVLPPCRWADASHPVSQAATTPTLDFEVFFRAKMLSSLVVLPTFGARSPLQLSSSSGTRNPPLLPPTEAGFCFRS